jgi:hypothetical protein
VGSKEYPYRILQPMNSVLFKVFLFSVPLHSF